MRVGLFTDRKGIGKSELVLCTHLQNEGIEVVGINWQQDLKEPFESIDVGIIRSTWDYYLNFTQFKTWLKKRNQTSQTPFYNQIDLVLWNSDKSYLSDLEQKGVNIIPTIVQEEFDYSVASQEFSTSELVIKPTIGASGYGVERISGPIGRKTGRILVQPYIQEVLQGEVSLVFFNGHYSYSVVRIPQGTDFKANTHAKIPARVEEFKPHHSLIQKASNIFTVLPSNYVPLYARVDGIIIDKRFYLMELELIEPSLFFYVVPKGAQNFSEAILKLM